MYVAGTRSFEDWANNPLILANQTRSTPRGRAATAYAHMYSPSRVVGHSLGGAVALDVAEDFGIPSETYGAPLVSFTSSTTRHRDYFDPVSMFDFGAVNRLSFPHSYRGYR